MESIDLSYAYSLVLLSARRLVVGGVFFNNSFRIGSNILLGRPANVANSSFIFLLNSPEPDYCSSSPCAQGATCVSDLSSFVCLCSGGTQLDLLCNPSPCVCENGGTCSTANGPCLCPVGM